MLPPTGEVTMSRSHRTPLLCLGLGTALVALGACASPFPNFGGLVADGRTLHVESSLQVVQVSNGLRVVLAPDRRTNLVSVDVRYNVGAAQDPAGKEGLAHLIEHLTFLGPGTGDGATVFDKLSSLSLWFNAYTNHDVTHYSSVGLAARIDALLELEARRMELDCSRIPAALFARERDVVVAEDAQRSNGWTLLGRQLNRAVWGADHPYARPVSSQDIARVTQEQACAFHSAFYAPDRAVLVVAGNFDAASLSQRIGRRFGPIVRSATGTVPPVLVPELEGDSRHKGDVEHPTAMIFLPAPPVGGSDQAAHEVVLDALAGELAELDDVEPWVVSADVSYGGAGRQRVTQIAVEVTDEARLDDAVEAVLTRGRGLFEDGDRDGHYDDTDDADDLAMRRLISSYRGRRQTRTVVDADRFAGRGIELADYMTYSRELRFAIGELEATDALTGAGLARYARDLFDRERAHVALVVPSGGGKAVARSVVAGGARTYDLQPWRSPVDPAEASRPLALPGDEPAVALDDFTLGNGLRVLLHADPSSPIVDARLVLPVGTLDEPDPRRGVAEVAAYMLDHDYNREFPLEIANKLNWALGLGTQLRRAASADTTVLASRGLAVYADWHVWRLAWLVDQGTYSAASLGALRRDLREASEREASPSGRAFVTRLYGRQHPNAREPVASAAMAALRVADLASWRARHFVPEGATLVVSGGFDAAAMRREVTALFGGWARRAPSPRTPVAAGAPTPGWLGTRVPTASQVDLYVSFAAQSEPERDRAARMVLAELVEERLRMVRERLGASYGVQVTYGGVGPGALHVSAGLEPDRAIEASQAVLAEFATIRDRPDAVAADLVRVRRRLVGQWLESTTDAAALADSLEYAVRRGGDPHDAHDLAARLAAVTLDDLAAVARADLDPARRVASVDGQAAPVKATLDALGATDVAWFDE